MVAPEPPSQSPAESSRPPHVLCVLTSEQGEEYRAELARLEDPRVELVYESSPGQALDRIGELHPRIIIVGMEVGPIEGLEFIALLMSRYRDFAGKIIVLPDKGDPFPPVVQFRDPTTGRSSTEQLGFEEIFDLIRAEADLEASQDAVAAPDACAAIAPAAAVSTLREPASLGPPAIEAALMTTAPVAPDPEPSGPWLNAAGPRAAAAPDPKRPAQIVTASSPNRAPPIPWNTVRWALIAAIAVVAVSVVIWLLALVAGSNQPAVPPDSRVQQTSTQHPAATVTSRRPGRTAPRAAPARTTRPREAGVSQDHDGSTRSRTRKPRLDRHTTLPFRFDQGSTTPHLTSASRLNSIVRAYADALEENARAKLEVGGHASLEGPNRRNEALGRRRAEAIRAIVIRKGIPPRRLVMKSYGTSMPVSSHDQPDGPEKCRRVTLRLVH